MTKKQKIEKDASAEERIMEAARKIFTQKGYAATRTRDIAEESGLNLALLNYYFRSKEKLFEIVMMEKVQKLFGILAPTLNDTTTSLEEKLKLIAYNYVETLSQTPDLPIFVLSEIKNNPDRFVNKMQVPKLLRESHFVKQLLEKRPDMNPLHFIFSLLGMSLFPFIGKQIFVSAAALNEKQFAELMEQRKVLIPKWINAMLEIE